ncbi:hypothetical protein [Arthrobacter koreensis]|jgi:hypothetical protein|nr:hypothetical protein [Arthrobacter koreensis]MEB7447786.1 hypothetical protein [Arthrobacter koreensis]
MSTTLTRRQWRAERIRQQRFTRFSYSAIAALVVSAAVVFAIAIQQT